MNGNGLPFEIETEDVGRGMVVFSATVNGESVTSERYAPGDGDKRRKVARQWAADDRLRNGDTIMPKRIVEALERAEANAIECMNNEHEVDDYNDVPEQSEGAVEKKKQDKPNQTKQLIELANQATLFHEPNAVDSSQTFADILDRHGTRQTWPIKSPQFKLWLSGLFYREHNRPPHRDIVKAVIEHLVGKALFDGGEIETHLRTAEHNGNYWIDLCDPEWRAVCVDAKGWRVVESRDVPVRFIRKRGMLALSEPERDGDLNKLRELVNVPDDDAWTLLLSWMVAAMKPTGPYPVLCVNGEQGSAKSSLCRIIRQLLDPNVCDLRRPPRDERDLMIAASNSWIVCMDNMSSLRDDLSDCLCTLATGGGFSTRELYSDDSEKLFNSQRPLILNGINPVATRSDLADRAIVLTLPTIPEKRRRDEAGLLAKFDKIRPRILGCLLNAVSVGIRNHDSVKLERMPRMADFAKWATATETGLGLDPGSFMRAYCENRESSNMDSIEASAIGPAVMMFIENMGEWSGTAEELLTALGDTVDEKVQSRREWPKSAVKLGRDLRRLATPMRSCGVYISFERMSGGRRTRMIRLSRTEPVETRILPSLLSQPSRNSLATQNRRYHVTAPGQHGTALRNCAVQKKTALRARERRLGTVGTVGTALCSQ